MLPASVSLRRAALRVTRRLSLATAAHGAPLARATAATVGTALVQRKSPMMTTQWFSTSVALDGILSADDELPEVVLEPLSGFADQKPLSDFDLTQQTLESLLSAGITHLFPVQAQSFDVMMKGADIVGRSKTGSGKTLAFALPIIERLQAETGKPARDPRALVLLPTRELAQQVADEIKRIAPQFRIVTVVGGVSYTTQENHLRRGADVLVGTPGRIMDLVEKGSLSLDAVRVSVLDEADMMLKFGFQEAVETILGWVPKEDRQVVMWSATFPKWVNNMAKQFTKNAVNIDLVGTTDNHVPATVSHKAIHAPIGSRARVLENVLRHRARGGQALIFTETKQEADEIANSLASMDAKALHGDLSQGMRTATMEGFRNGSVKTLVCTDIAARGLDIANVELVVQYRLPHDKESFVHRAGRTGRAGRSGTNIVFFDRNDVGDVRDFEKRFKFSFQHASAPHVEQVLDVAVSDITKKLADVPAEATRVFDESAQRMFEEQGVGALSAALAMLCGFDKEHLSAMSMLTGRGKTQTVEVAGVEHARTLHGWLAGFDDRTARIDLHPIDDKFVFDIPQDSIERLRAHLLEVAGEDVTVSPVYELSRVLMQGNQRNEGRSFGGGRGGGGYRGGGGGGGYRGGNNRDGGGFGYAGRRRNDGERGGFRNRDRDFDSSFSRGGDRDRSPRRGSSSSSLFGRFSEGSPRKSGGSGGFRESW